VKIRIECEGAKNLPLESLLPTQDQLKELSQDNYAKLKNEILSEGFSFPFFVWQHNNENRILDGHHRRLVLIKMREEGYEIPELPCAIVKANNEKEAARKLLAVTSQYAKITDQGLYEFMNKFDIDMSEIKDRFEFSDIDLDAFEDNFFAEVEQLPDGDEDEVPEVLHDPITKRGDVWILGEHRLMCGDSTMIDDVEKLMNGEKADMVFTDPPYGMFLDTDYSDMKGWSQGKKYKPVAGDNEDFSEDLINTIFTFDYVKEMFIWGADYFAELLPNKNNGSWLVWDKRVDESKDAMYGSCFELCWSKNKHKREFLRYMWAGFMGDKEAKNRVHPTQKPTEMIAQMFDKWCKGLSKCVDLYGGSGSTMIACEKTEKSNYTMELDEHYCDVIINRWQNYTGKKARLETGEYYNDLLDARQ